MTFIFQSAQNISLKIKMDINIGVEKQNFCVFAIKIQDVVGTPIGLVMTLADLPLSSFKSFLFPT